MGQLYFRKTPILNTNNIMPMFEQKNTLISSGRNISDTVNMLATSFPNRAFIKEA